jgi:hypothetical protein
MAVERLREKCCWVAPETIRWADGEWTRNWTMWRVEGKINGRLRPLVTTYSTALLAALEIAGIDERRKP